MSNEIQMLRNELVALKARCFDLGEQNSQMNGALGAILRELGQGTVDGAIARIKSLKELEPKPEDEETENAESHPVETVDREVHQASDAGAAEVSRIEDHKQAG